MDNIHFGRNMEISSKSRVILYNSTIEGSINGIIPAPGDMNCLPSQSLFTYGKEVLL